MKSRIAVLVFAAGMLIAGTGCRARRSSEPDISVEEPRSSGGILLEDQDPESFAALVARLESDSQRPVEQHPAGREDTIPEVDQALGGPVVVDVKGAGSLPPESTVVLQLPRVGGPVLDELLDLLDRDLRTGLGYRYADHVETRRAEAFLEKDLETARILVLSATGGLRVLQFGYWQYMAHAPRFFACGVTVNGATVGTNPDLHEIEILLEQAVRSMGDEAGDLTFHELESRIIQLSYVDAAAALNALGGMGFRTVVQGSSLPEQIGVADLPIVVELPTPPPEAIGLVGKSQVEQGEFGVTVMPNVAGELSPETIGYPTNRLLVLYHPAAPEQFSRVKELLDTIIDRPARQIYVEAMILEISSIGLKELGIEWEFQRGDFMFSGGSLRPDFAAIDALRNTLEITGDSLQDFDSEWAAKLRALILDGKARILSRPSVLTLDGRQATIRVGQDIPIATSQEGLQSDSSKISFDFRYIPLGILLNIRPRLSEDSREISMMVDTVVSSRIAEADLEIRDQDGRLLASAPRISTRRVQTYARIQNNTPFTIGGLVGTDSTTIQEKVPILGYIPLLGALFRSERIDNRRTEVIIVLTPYVLPEQLHLSRALPKGDYIDSAGNDLFRDTRRIRTEDIVDVSFLYRNQRVQAARESALGAIRRDFRLAGREPYRSFAEGHLPGERILVDHITYNALERFGESTVVPPDGIIVLEKGEPNGYRVDSIEGILARKGYGESLDDFFKLFPGKALALSFHDLYEAPETGDLLSDPVPEIAVVNCPDRQGWLRLLWELNRRDEDGRQRYTILIHRPEDLVRLGRAIIVKHTLELNGGRPRASLLDFVPGRMIEVPSPRAHQKHLVDAESGRYFFHSTQHFYASTVEQIDATLKELDRDLPRVAGGE